MYRVWEGVTWEAEDISSQLQGLGGVHPKDCGHVSQVQVWEVGSHWTLWTCDSTTKFYLTFK